MGIKRMIVVCIVAVAVSVIPAMSVVCVEADNRGSVSASGAGDAIHTGMSKQDVFEIYHLGDIQKYERKDNKEVMVFDDVLSSHPEDTITIYLVDGKVDSWDKNTVIFPTDEELRSSIRVGMPKNELLEIYPIGNLRSYARVDNTEVGIFNDILSSDPNDTITFYFVDGKVSSWDKKTAESDAYARSKARITAEAKSKAESDAAAKSKADADAKLKAKADFDEIMAMAKADAAARTKAMEERKKYDSSSQGYPTYDANLMKTKQQNRASSVRSTGWYYNGGLYYR